MDRQEQEQEKKEMDVNPTPEGVFLPSYASRWMPWLKGIAAVTAFIFVSASLLPAGWTAPERPSETLRGLAVQESSAQAGLEDALLPSPAGMEAEERSRTVQEIFKERGFVRDGETPADYVRFRNPKTKQAVMISYGQPDIEEVGPEKELETWHGRLPFERELESLDLAAQMAQELAEQRFIWLLPPVEVDEELSAREQFQRFFSDEGSAEKNKERMKASEGFLREHPFFRDLASSGNLLERKKFQETLEQFRHWGQEDLLKDFPSSEEELTWRLEEKLLELIQRTYRRPVPLADVQSAHEEEKARERAALLAQHLMSQLRKDPFTDQKRFEEFLSDLSGLLKEFHPAMPKRAPQVLERYFKQQWETRRRGQLLGDRVEVADLAEVILRAFNPGLASVSSVQPEPAEGKVIRPVGWSTEFAKEVRQAQSAGEQVMVLLLGTHDVRQVGALWNPKAKGTLTVAAPRLKIIAAEEQVKGLGKRLTQVKQEVKEKERQVRQASQKLKVSAWRVQEMEEELRWLGNRPTAPEWLKDAEKELAYAKKRFVEAEQWAPQVEKEFVQAQEQHYYLGGLLSEAEKAAASLRDLSSREGVEPNQLFDFLAEANSRLADPVIEWADLLYGPKEEGSQKRQGGLAGAPEVQAVLSDRLAFEWKEWQEEEQAAREAAEKAGEAVSPGWWPVAKGILIGTGKAALLGGVVLAGAAMFSGDHNSFDSGGIETGFSDLPDLPAGIGVGVVVSPAKTPQRTTGPPALTVPDGATVLKDAAASAPTADFLPVPSVGAPPGEAKGAGSSAGVAAAAKGIGPLPVAGVAKAGGAGAGGGAPPAPSVSQEAIDHAHALVRVSTPGQAPQWAVELAARHPRPAGKGFVSGQAPILPVAGVAKAGGAGAGGGAPPPPSVSQEAIDHAHALVRVSPSGQAPQWAVELAAKHPRSTAERSVSQGRLPKLPQQGAEPRSPSPSVSDGATVLNDAAAAAPTADFLPVPSVGVPPGEAKGAGSSAGAAAAAKGIGPLPVAGVAKAGGAGAGGGAPPSPPDSQASPAVTRPGSLAASPTPAVTPPTPVSVSQETIDHAHALVAVSPTGQAPQWAVELAAKHPRSVAVSQEAIDQAHALVGVSPAGQAPQWAMELAAKHPRPVAERSVSQSGGGSGPPPPDSQATPAGPFLPTPMAAQTFPAVSPPAPTVYITDPSQPLGLQQQDFLMKNPQAELRFSPFSRPSLAPPTGHASGFMTRGSLFPALGAATYRGTGSVHEANQSQVELWRLHRQQWHALNDRLTSHNQQMAKIRRTAPPSDAGDALARYSGSSRIALQESLNRLVQAQEKAEGAARQFLRAKETDRPALSAALQEAVRLRIAAERDDETVQKKLLEQFLRSFGSAASSTPLQETKMFFQESRRLAELRLERLEWLNRLHEQMSALGYQLLPTGPLPVPEKEVVRLPFVSRSGAPLTREDRKRILDSPQNRALLREIYRIEGQILQLHIGRWNRVTRGANRFLSSGREVDAADLRTVKILQSRVQVAQAALAELKLLQELFSTADPKTLAGIQRRLNQAILASDRARLNHQRALLKLPSLPAADPLRNRQIQLERRQERIQSDRLRIIEEGDLRLALLGLALSPSESDRAEDFRMEDELLAWNDVLRAQHNILLAAQEIQEVAFRRIQALGELGQSNAMGLAAVREYGNARAALADAIQDYRRALHDRARVSQYLRESLEDMMSSYRIDPGRAPGNMAVSRRPWRETAAEEAMEGFARQTRLANQALEGIAFQARRIQQAEQDVNYQLNVTAPRVANDLDYQSRQQLKTLQDRISAIRHYESLALTHLVMQWAAREKARPLFRIEALVPSVYPGFIGEPNPEEIKAHLDSFPSLQKGRMDREIERLEVEVRDLGLQIGSLPWGMGEARGVLERAIAVRKAQIEVLAADKQRMEAGPEGRARYERAAQNLIERDLARVHGELKYLQHLPMRLDAAARKRLTPWLEAQRKKLTEERGNLLKRKRLYEMSLARGMPLVAPLDSPSAPLSPGQLQFLENPDRGFQGDGFVQTHGTNQRVSVWTGSGTQLFIEGATLVGGDRLGEAETVLDSATGNAVLKGRPILVSGFTEKGPGTFVVEWVGPWLSDGQDRFLTVVAIEGMYSLDPQSPIPLGQVAPTDPRTGEILRDPKTGRPLPARYGLVGYVAYQAERIKGAGGVGRYELVPRHLLTRHVPLEVFHKRDERGKAVPVPWGPDAVGPDGRPNQDPARRGTAYRGGLQIGDAKRQPEGVRLYGDRNEPGQRLPPLYASSTGLRGGQVVPGDLPAVVEYEVRVRFDEEEGRLYMGFGKRPVRLPAVGAAEAPQPVPAAVPPDEPVVEEEEGGIPWGWWLVAGAGAVALGAGAGAWRLRRRPSGLVVAEGPVPAGERPEPAVPGSDRLERQLRAARTRLEAARKSRADLEVRLDLAETPSPKDLKDYHEAQQAEIAAEEEMTAEQARAFVRDFSARWGVPAYEEGASVPEYKVVALAPAVAGTKESLKGRSLRIGGGELVIVPEDSARIQKMVGGWAVHGQVTIDAYPAGEEDAAMKRFGELADFSGYRVVWKDLESVRDRNPLRQLLYNLIGERAEFIPEEELMELERALSVLA